MESLVKIAWHGQGGELDSVAVYDDGACAIANAIIKMIQGSIVAPGDSLTVEVINHRD